MDSGTNDYGDRSLQQNTTQDNTATTTLDGSDVLEEVPTMAPTSQVATRVFETNELLSLILSQVRGDAVRRVSKTWNSVVSDLVCRLNHHRIDPYPCVQNQVLKHPGPHYPWHVKFRVNPIFEHSFKRVLYEQRRRPQQPRQHPRFTRRARPAPSNAMLHFLGLKDVKNILKLQDRGEQFLTSPPVTELDLGLHIAPKYNPSANILARTMRQPGGIKIKHLLEACIHLERSEDGAGYNGLLSCYACFMVCDDCRSEAAAIPSGYCDIEDRKAGREVITLPQQMFDYLHQYEDLLRQSQEQQTAGNVQMARQLTRQSMRLRTRLILMKAHFWRSIFVFKH